MNANIKEDFVCDDEKMLSTAMIRLNNVDSPRLLRFWKNTLENFKEHNTISKFNNEEEKMILMLHYTLFTKAPIDLGINSIHQFLERIYSNKEIYEEILDVIKYNLTHIKIKPLKDRLEYDSLMEAHCTYTKEQILCALGKNTIEKQYPLREGVLYIDELKTDVFLITLNKVENIFHHQLCMKIMQSMMNYLIGKVKVELVMSLRLELDILTIEIPIIKYFYLLEKTVKRKASLVHIFI